MGKIKRRAMPASNHRDFSPLNVPVLYEVGRPPSHSLTILNTIALKRKMNQSDFWGRLHTLPRFVSLVRAFGAGPDGLVSEILGGLCSPIPSLVYPPGLLCASQTRGRLLRAFGPSPNGPLSALRRASL
jgi:hypothetical protein